MGFAYRIAVIGFILLVADFGPIHGLGPAGNSAVRNETEAVALLNDWTLESYQKSRNYYLQSSKIYGLGPAESARFLREAARLSLILGDYANASAELDLAIALEENGVYLNGKIKSISCLLQVNLRSGKIEKSEQLVKELLSLSARTEDPSARAHSAFSRGEFSALQGSARKQSYFSKSPCVLQD